MRSYTTKSPVTNKSKRKAPAVWAALRCLHTALMGLTSCSLDTGFLAVETGAGTFVLTTHGALSFDDPASCFSPSRLTASLLGGLRPLPLFVLCCTSLFELTVCDLATTDVSTALQTGVGLARVRTCPQDEAGGLRPVRQFDLFFKA